VAGKLHNQELLTSAHTAFIHGSNLVLVACGLVSLLAAVLAALFLPPKSEFPVKEKAEKDKKNKDGKNGRKGEGAGAEDGTPADGADAPVSSGAGETLV
jgi:L-lactate permease